VHRLLEAAEKPVRTSCYAVLMGNGEPECHDVDLINFSRFGEPLQLRKLAECVSLLPPPNMVLPRPPRADSKAALSPCAAQMCEPCRSCVEDGTVGQARVPLTAPGR